MARIRTIKPAFWDNRGISHLSLPARLLFIGLWTFADDLGVIAASPLFIRSRIFPTDPLELEEVENWIQELVSTQHIIPLTYEEESYYFVKAFPSHQQINKPNIVDVCIPKNILKEMTKQYRKDSPTNPGTIQEESMPIEKDRIEKKQKVKNKIEKDKKGKKRKEEKEREEEIYAPSPFSKEEFEELSTLTDKYCYWDKWKKQNLPHVSKLEFQMTEEEFGKILENYDMGEIVVLMKRMDNCNSLEIKYNNVYTTLLNWLANEK